MTVGLNPLNPPPLPPTVEVRATELPCTAAAPVFWLACRMPIPFIEYCMLIVPEALDDAAVCLVLFPASAALVTAEPAPAVIVLVAV